MKPAPPSAECEVCDFFWYGEPAGMRVKCKTHSRFADHCVNDKNALLAAKEKEIERLIAMIDSAIEYNGFSVRRFNEDRRALEGGK